SITHAVSRVAQETPVLNFLAAKLLMGTASLLTFTIPFTQKLRNRR
ncbi:Os06g0514100, partial [Oryza sativa Japonica Group]